MLKAQKKTKLKSPHLHLSKKGLQGYKNSKNAIIIKTKKGQYMTPQQGEVSYMGAKIKNKLILPEAIKIARGCHCNLFLKKQHFIFTHLHLSKKGFRIYSNFCIASEKRKVLNIVAKIKITSPLCF